MPLGAAVLAMGGAAALVSHWLLLLIGLSGSPVVQTRARQRAEADVAAYGELFGAMRAHRDNGRARRGTRPARGWTVL